MNENRYRQTMRRYTYVTLVCTYVRMNYYYYYYYLLCIISYNVLYVIYVLLLLLILLLLLLCIMYYVWFCIIVYYYLWKPLDARRWPYGSRWSDSRGTVYTPRPPPADPPSSALTEETSCTRLPTNITIFLLCWVSHIMS